MKVTKKAINNALPSIRYFDKYYVPRGFAGIMPENASTLSNVIFRIDEDGDIIERDYGVGDAYEPEDYRMEGFCVEANEIIAEWMYRRISREEVVSSIQELFANWEDEQEFL